MAIFWSKYKSDTAPPFHDLLGHMIDVASVAVALLKKFTPSLKLTQIASEFKLNATTPPAEIVSLLSFFAGCHDLGKATPGFQAKKPEQKQKLRSEGLNFDCISAITLKKIQHNIATAAILPETFISLWNSWQPYNIWLNRVAKILGGHHGVFPSDGEILTHSSYSGRGKWCDERLKLLTTFAVACGLPPEGPPIPAAYKPSADFYMFLAGLTSVADWIASDERYFRYVWPVDNPVSYSHQARFEAEKVLE